MSTTTQTDAVSVTLTPSQADCVAETLFSFLSGEMEDVGEITTPAQFDTIRAVLDNYQAWFCAIAWGKPSNDVELTVPSGVLRDVAGRLAEVDCVINSHDQLREEIRRAEAGLAIIDQLAAEPVEA